MSIPTPGAPANLPLLFDHYQVERVLGSGAMGVVYLARDLRIGRLVALKTLSPRLQRDESEETETFLHRFRREAQLSGALVHPNIVTLYEVGYERNQFTFLAMEFVDGESLQSLMRRTGVLPLDAACRIADDVLQALGHAHAHGIVHRDVKPANILVRVNGQAKLTDFGIARAQDGNQTDITAHGQILGTPHYMSPEQIAGEPIDGRADLFSVGVIMFEMLTGRKPFEGAGLTDVLYHIVHQPAPKLPDTVPPWCAAFVMKLLAKDPDERFADAHEAARELRRAMTKNQILFAEQLPPVHLRVERQISADETPTTPIIAPDFAMRSESVLRRTLPRGVVLPILAGVLIAFGAFVVSMTRHIDEGPTASFSPGQLETMREKKASLDAAIILYEAGALEESRRRFERHLTLYPESAVAQEWLDRVDAQLASRVTVAPDTPSKKQTISKASPRKVTPQKRKTFWSRVRSIFTRDR